MKKTFMLLVAMLILFNIFLVGDKSAFAFPSSPDETKNAGHRGLSKMSSDIKYNLPESVSNGLQPAMKNCPGGYEDGFKKSVANSNVSEDGASGLLGFFHFYDPDNGNGYLGLATSAKDTARKWHKQALWDYCYAKKNNLSSKGGWSDFGHVEHLMQDMLTPAHTNNVSHISGDSFEEYVKNNWDTWDPNTPPEGKIPGYSGLKDYLEDYAKNNPYNPSEHQLNTIPEYFDKLAKQSEDYPVDKWTSDITGTLHKEEISWEQKNYNAKKLLPKAMMYGAGLINKFWKDVNDPRNADICNKPLNYSPGNDYPDDTFDISDGFLIESSQNLAFDKKASLFARTAVKKGKPGAVYTWQAVDIYMTGMAALTYEEKKAADIKLEKLKEKISSSSSQYQQDFATAPDIAILNNGYYEEAASLILKHNEPVVLSDTNINPEMVKDHPVLIIPSGGLYGMENSTFLKSSLSEYVKQGGTLIVFAQQHGYEFSVLPVPQEADGTYKTITGYGWQEDQSCFGQAAYIDEWHQMLSSQSKSTPDLNIDGYFTGYPSNSTILLRRTANGQPALLMYEYGQGKVIVTSMYSDYAFSRNQASSEEKALARDIISWAKKPAQLAEIKPDQTVSVPIEAKNNTDVNAASVKIQIYNPDRTTLISEQQTAVSILPGQTTTTLVTYTAPLNAQLGIYHIDYVLYDSTGNIIQPQAETDSGRFAVNNPASNPYKSPDFNFSIQTDSEQYTQGSQATFTVVAWNNTDTDANITLESYDVHIMQWGHVETYQLYVPAKSSASINVVIPHVLYSGVLQVRAYYASRMIGFVAKGVHMVRSSVDVNVKTDKTIYRKGEDVNLNLNVQNKQSINNSIVLNVKVLDPSNAVVYSTSLDMNLAANGSLTRDLSFVLASGALSGTYLVSIEGFDQQGKKIASGSTPFESPKSQIAVIPSLPPVFAMGTNTMSFLLSNNGKIDISSGLLDISLKDPDGAIIYSSSQNFSIAVNQNITFNISIVIPDLKFGNYVLTYVQSDETQQGKPVIMILPNNQTIVSISADKSEYKIGETANIVLSLNNTGKFKQEGTLTIAVPALELTDIKTVVINPSEGLAIPYSFSLPAILGTDVILDISFALSGKQLQSSLPVKILPLEFGQQAYLVFDKPSYKIKEILGMNYMLTSYGNFVVPLNATFSLSIPDINYSYNSPVIIEPDKRMEIPSNVAIPETLEAGQHKVFTSIALYSGAVYNNTFYFTVSKSALNIKMPDTSSFSIGDTITVSVENIGGVDTNSNYNVSLYGNNTEIYWNNLTENISVGMGKTYTFQIPAQATSGEYVLYANAQDAKTGKWVSYSKSINISGLTADFSVKTDKDIYFSAENITGLSRIINGAYSIGDANLHLQIVGKCSEGIPQSFYFYTWNGEGWIERGVLHYPNTFQSQMIDLSAYLPDVANEYKVRIKHEGTYNAEIDELLLDLGEGFTVPNSALNINTSQDITERLVNYDGLTAYVLNNEIEVRWTDVFLNTDEKLIMTAKEGTYSCREQIYWQEDIPVTQSANTVSDLNRIVDALNITGQFYLQGTLTSSTGQLIAEAEYPFSIIDGNIGLRFKTDKAIYKPGETVNVTGDIFNLSNIEATGIKSEISDGITNIYSETFNIPASGNRTFSFTITAGSEGVYQLFGTALQNGSPLTSVGTRYEVSVPKIEAYLYGPEVVGSAPFALDFEVYNTGKVPVTIQVAVSGGSLSDTQTVTVPVNGNKLLQYNQQITGDTIYTVTISGDVNQAQNYQVFFGEKAEVQINAQQAYRAGEITIPYLIKNTGTLEATYSVECKLTKDEQEVLKTSANFVLPVNGSDSRNINLNLAEGIYELICQTIGSQATVQINVVKTSQLQIALNANEIYPEGLIAASSVITNTGLIDQPVTVIYSIQPEALTQTKNYNIPKGGSITDTLYFDVKEGSYQLAATSIEPAFVASANFEVRKDNKVTMGVSVGVQINDLIPATVNLMNLGVNNIDGSVQLSVINNQGISVWNTSQEVSLPYAAIPNPYALTLNINPAAITPGDYTVKVELFDNSNQSLVSASQPLNIKGAIVQIIQLPPSQTFSLGQMAEMTFKVKNTGNQEGSAEIRLRVYDLIDSTQIEWVAAGQEKEITFNFRMPTDLEEKDYFADYDFKGIGTQEQQGQVKYHLAGINISVNASLDKQNYREGETTHLTLTISNQQSAINSINLFARVNYNGYESQQTFTLNGSQTLTFDVPLEKITGEKLFYGIYHEEGRSIHLNSLYIYKISDVITISTNKQVYNPGESVAITISSQQAGVSGQMTLDAPNYTETFSFAGSASKSFTLSSAITAGTYNISCQLSTASGETYTASQLFDIAGISVKVKEATLDKGKYAATDTMKLSLQVESNIAMPAVLKAWIIDPEGKYTSIGESNINLTSPENLLFANNYSLSTVVSGVHRLVYAIYSGEMILVSGSEAFDVGDAVLLGLSTDKTDYPTNTETVKVKASMYGATNASTSGNLELQIDGITVKNEAMTLNGFMTSEIILNNINPGAHVLKGILTTGGLKSTKETSFIYGSSLPDLAVSSYISEVKKDSTTDIKITITNKGKTISTATSVDVYDGDVLIGTQAINGLNTNESQDLTLIWNVLGKAGQHTIKAIADPNNLITEFNKDNNTVVQNITIPDISLALETDKGNYRMGQTVGVVSTITNLTSATNYPTLTLLTTATDPTGKEVYRNSSIINAIQPSNTLTQTNSWEATGLTVEGAYSIIQIISSGTQILAQKTKTITFEKSLDFSITTANDKQKIKQGEKAIYDIHVEPFSGWTAEVSLNIEGLPSGASVTYNPGKVVPPGDSQIEIITTSSSPAGMYTLTLIAQGTDTGAASTHTLPLTLDITGFSLEPVPVTQTIKQLETAEFTIKANAVNNYEGELVLSSDTNIKGLLINFESKNILVPSETKVRIISSKFVIPGTYTITINASDGIISKKLDLPITIFENSAIAFGVVTTPGPGPKNPALVRLVSREFVPIFDLMAFDTKFGATVIMADIDEDGNDEIVVAPGPDPRAKGKIRIYKKNGALMLQKKIFDTKFGLSLAAGDINSDWKEEIIIGTGPDFGHTARVKIFAYNGLDLVETGVDFEPFASDNKGWRWWNNDVVFGVNVALGDVDGDGVPELVVGTGLDPRNNPRIKVFKIDTAGGIGRWKIASAIADFDVSFGEEHDYMFGVNVATGDIDGDGKAEIITGAGLGPWSKPVVKVYKGDGTFTGIKFNAYPGPEHHECREGHHERECGYHEDKEHECHGGLIHGYRYGVNVASGDIDGDGKEEIITGAGPGPLNKAWVRIFKGDGTLLSNGFIAYPEDTKYGVKVSVGNIGK